MSSIGLNVGLKALLASQTALDTVGHNISNASTPGYSRQSVHLSASQAQIIRGLSIGNGVDADVILRTADDLLSKRIVAQGGSISQLDTRLAGMSQVEALLGEPGERGLHQLMQTFFSSLSSLAATPENPTLRTGVVQSTQSLAARFQELSGNLASEKRDAAQQITAQVEQVNTLAREVSRLNREIGSAEGSGLTANDLRDQRDEALKQLGAIVNISYQENSRGLVTVQTNGAVLVGESRTYAMSATLQADGTAEIRVEGNPKALNVKGGSIGGLVRLSQEFVPDLSAKLDALAHNFILEMNRAHSTGIPGRGAFQTLTASNALVDVNGDGDRTDELLSNAGLPFEVQSGSVYVNVSSRSSTGSFTSTKIDIDPARTSVADFIAALNAIDHMSAGLDSAGRLQISASDDFRFDFSRRVQASPDAAGAFGGGAASLGAASAGPYSLANGDTLDVSGSPGAFSITFQTAQFQDITQASAAEVVAAINADPAAASSGMRAVESGGRVVLQSIATGSAASFTVAGGSSLAAFGWSAGTAASGQAQAVSVTVSGTNTGASNQSYTFVPSSDGSIGTTSGLTVDVFDASGTRVATLDVGAGYRPGTPLDLPNGLKVSFGIGQISATDHDVFALDALADSDTSDVLVALGVNSLFTGSNASDIALRADLEGDPGAIASSMSGAPGDNTILNDLLGAQSVEMSGLDRNTFGGFYGDIVSGVGFDIDGVKSAHDVEQFLAESLEARRQSISGVNVDEELVNMIQFQQSYAAAAQYIQVVNQTHEELLRLI